MKACDLALIALSHAATSLTRGMTVVPVHRLGGRLSGENGSCN